MLLENSDGESESESVNVLNKIETVSDITTETQSKQKKSGNTNNHKQEDKTFKTKSHFQILVYRIMCEYFNLDFEGDKIIYNF